MLFPFGHPLTPYCKSPKPRTPFSIAVFYGKDKPGLLEGIIRRLNMQPGKPFSANLLPVFPLFQLLPLKAGQES
jgi:hypothetical protein